MPKTRFTTAANGRGKPIGILFGALVAALATQAFATVGPPIKIRMPADTKQAVSGEAYDGVFEIHVGLPGTLTDFQIKGEGWTMLSADFASLTGPAAAGVLRIPFRAVPTDADKPIGLSFRYDGRPVRRSYDLGPASAARASQRGLIRRVETSDLPVAPPGSHAAAEGDASSPNTRGGAIPLRFTGRFIYQRSDGRLAGADHIRVWVMDDDGLASDPNVDETIWTGTTDETGFFDSGVISWDDCDSVGCDEPDIYVHFECDTAIAQVQADSVLEEDYYWRTMDNIIEDFTGTEVDFGTLAPIDGNDAAVHIWNSIIRAHRYVQDRSGIDLPIVDVQWPESEDGAFYNSFYEEIHIGPNRTWIEGTHTHEYGHHFLENRAVNPSPDYCNGFCDGDGACDFDTDCPDEGHCGWCPETEHDAFNEGFPHWLGHVVPRDYENHYVFFDDGSPYQPLEPKDYEDLDTCCVDGMPYDPFFTEGFVAALLVDIHDGEQDDHDDDGVFDLLCLGPEEILYVTDVYEPITVSDFIIAFLAEYPQHTGNFWATAFNVAPAYVSNFPADTQPPGLVPFCNSSTHPLGVGGPLPCITIEFSPAPDDLRGACQYSAIATTNPAGTDPGESAAPVSGTGGCKLTTTVAAPALGDWYISIKAQDNAGNWSSQWATFGPFEVTDCNGTGILDVCDIDCASQGIPGCMILDLCAAQTGCGLSEDCNANLQPDECDLAQGLSEDCNINQSPDECEPFKHWSGGGMPDPTGWHLSGNWEEGAAPALMDEVCIAAGLNTPQLRQNAYTIGTLACYQDLDVTGGSLTVSAPFPSFVQRDLEISGLGVFEVALGASLDVFGMLRMSGNNATLRGGGITRVWEGMEIGQTLPIINNGHRLENLGVATATGGLLVTNGSVFTNRPGALYDKQHGYYYAFAPGTGSFVNEGIFRKSGPDAVQIAVALANSGLVHVQLGTLEIVPLFNAGSNNTGTFWGDPETLLYFGGGNHFFHPGSTILADAVKFENLGSGGIDIQGTYNVSTSTTLRASQPITFAAGANVINYGATVNVQADARFNAVAGGPIAIDTLNVTSGTARFNSGDPVNVVTLNVGNQGGTVRGPSPITVSGLLTWNQAGHFFDQAAVNANGGLLVPAGSNVRSLNQRIFYNAGPATFLGSVDLAASATFNNLATGVMDIQADGTLFGGGGPGQVINNSGTMRKSAGAGSSWIYVNVVNTGTVEAQVGDIRFQNAAYTQSLGSTLLTGGSISAITQGGTATGTLNFWGGELRGDGSVSAHVANVSATVAPGLSAGVLDVLGNYTQGAAGVLEIELGGPLQGTDHDWLNVSGSASLAGTLQVELINGFAPMVGQQFEVLTAGSVVGTFDTVESLTPGLDLNVIYGPTTVILEIASAPGDCDDDGDVDLDDYDLFDGCWSGPVAPYGPPGCDCIDLDADLDIDLADFVEFQMNFTG